jgi:cytidylate kinase
LRPRGIVVAIDGPSGAGKSTVGRALAERLGYTYIDTGAMYRALAWKALQTSVSLDSDSELAALAQATGLELVDGGRRVLVDGADVTAEIRSPEVSAAASRVSVHGGVRRNMVARQRAMGRSGGVVLDGRDIGTAVFPDAEVKFYLDADPAQRARRRHEELQRAGAAVSLQAVEREVRERDHSDTHRAESPLARAADAIVLDTTALAPDSVLARMLEIVAAVTASARSGTNDES